MIPLYDENDTENMPVVTVMLVIVNVLIFGWQALTYGSSVQSFWMDYGVIPSAFLAHPLSLQTLHFFSSMFLHADVFHLLGNMWFLSIFGDNVEDRMGHGNFLCFYIGCGILANLAHVATNAHSSVPTIGASGAIAGVLGAYILLFPDAQVKTWMGRFVGTIDLPAWMVLGQWVLFQWLAAYLSHSGTAGGVAVYAHLGGFVAGFLLVHLFARNDAPFSTSATTFRRQSSYYR